MALFTIISPFPMRTLLRILIGNLIQINQRLGKSLHSSLGHGNKKSTVKGGGSIAVGNLQRWRVDDEDILRQIPETA